MNPTTTPTVMRAGVGDLIALAFYQVGYRPRESLLLVGLRGTRQRVGVVARVDLPPARYRREMIESQLRLLRRELNEQAVALVVSDAEPPLDSPGPVRLPHRGLVREVRKLARRQGVRIVDVLAVGADSWWSYQCRDLSCCPAEGRPLDEALSGPVAAQLVALGEVLAPDEESLLADVVPPEVLPPDVGTAPSAPRPAGDEAAERPRPVDPTEALDRWRELLARPAQLRPDDLAWLADALEDRWLRDAILLTLIPASGTAPDEVLAGADSATMDGVFDADPDADLLERGRSLLAAVARSAPAGRRADALALLAWAAWWSGHGARGRLLAQRALADRPAHRLAGLVDQLLRRAVAPGWIERRRGEEVTPGHR